MIGDPNETSPDLIIREPTAPEIPRALSLFQRMPPPAESWLLVAARTKPIPRFVAASAAWLKGDMAQFRLACRPGVSCTSIAAPLILKLEVAWRAQGARSLQYADLLADSDDMCGILEQQGFVLHRSERFFEVDTTRACQRVMDLADRFSDQVPKSWRVESIRQHSPRTVADLVSHYRLLSLGDLERYWSTDYPFAFDLDLSAILFDADIPVGVILLRRSPEAYVVDVRVVAHHDPRLRALGNICLFRHVGLQGDPQGQIRSLQFRGGESEHRETANLALRMGGRELPPRRIMAKLL